MLDRAWCAVVITAAGASSRMGRPKALVDWHDQPLLLHQLAAFEGFGQRIVVLGASAEHILETLAFPGDTDIVVNPDWEAGRSGSLRRAFANVKPSAKAVVVVAVDQPVEPEVVDALLAAFDPGRHAYAVPVTVGRRGHPLLLSGVLADSVRRFGDSESLRDLTHRYADSAMLVPVDSRSCVLDLNTPQDLALATATDPVTVTGPVSDTMTHG